MTSYKNYVKLCKRLNLTYGPTDITEDSNYKIISAIIERIEKLEKDQHRHSNMQKKTSF